MELVAGTGEMDAASTSRIAANLTRTGLKLGTAGYMSPEQVRGEALDARTDIFSFGLVLYEMATGERAFPGQTEAILHEAIVSREPRPLREWAPETPPQLAAAIGKCLEKEPERRYQSAAELRVELEALKPHAKAVVERRPSHAWKALLAAALLIATAVGGVTYWRSRNAVKLTNRDTIVLADFTNSTTDPVFSDALNTALRVEMEQTPFLNVIAPDKVRGILKHMNLPADSRLTPDTANTVCLQSNSKAVLAPAIADAGNHYRLGLKAVECRTAKAIATTEVEADHRNEVVKMLGVASARLRRQLGEPEAILKRFNQPLEEATSSSLEALQAYAKGSAKVDEDSSTLSGRPYFKRVVDLDAKFAMAWANLGALYYDTGEFPLAMESAKKAFGLRERLDQRSRWYTEALYYDVGTGELEKANDVYKQWIQTFPTDPIAHSNFFGSLSALGQHERSLVEAREAVRLQPTTFNYLNLMRTCLKMNRLEDAKAVFTEAQANKVDDWVMQSDRYYIALLQGDKATMKASLAWEMSHSEAAKEWATNQQGWTAVLAGRLRRSRYFFSKTQSYNPDLPERLAERALQELEIGNPRLAKQMTFRALAANPSPRIKGTLALVFARTGETTQAEALMGQINQLYPLNTMIQKYVLPTIRAAIELDKNQAANAVEILKAAAPYELGSTPAFSSLYPVYIRGLAYLKLGQGREAAAEFQKMIEHPGIVEDIVTSPLSRLQLARAQAMMGDKEGARKSYKDFLTLWRDADPDIPILKEARAEYTKL